MATINRAPWTALVDDSGQNLDGSIWNKAAIKTVLLDPIDAALATQATTTPTILAKANGTNTGTGNVTYANVLIPALAQTESLRVLLSFTQTGGAGSALYIVGNGEPIVRLDDLPGSAIVNGITLIVDIVIRMQQVNTKAFASIVLGGAVGSGGYRSQAVTLSVPDWLAGGWNLGITSTAQAAGGTQYYAWEVIKL